jgi:hypothetical protein
MLIKYQSPIPSAGPIYNAYKTITNARINYYSVPFAPYGRLQGTGLGTGTGGGGSANPGHVSNLTQADINTASATASPFNMTISHAWNVTGDSVTATVNITTPAAFAPSGGNLKLRIAVVEHLVYANPPGTNGEKDFHNVVREMVPDANGTQILNSWTATQTQTYTVKGRLNGPLDKTNTECILVAWIQNDADKTIYLASKSTHVTIPTDAGATASTAAATLGCTTASSSVASTMTLKNTGTSTSLTSAKIYYRADNGTYGTTPVNWTGSLAPGATTTVSIPAVTLSIGSRKIIDSIAQINGNPDPNSGNNVISAPVTVITTATVPYPFSQNFEAAGFPANWVAYEPAGLGFNWVNGSNGPGTKLAHNGSDYMPWYSFWNYPTGLAYLIIPRINITGAAAIDFWQAYAQKTASTNDKLELVYSTNCGTSWTTLWSAAGSALATTSPQSAYWLPSPSVGSTDWTQRSVSLSSVPANSVIAFRATANGGNNLFLDDINVRVGNVGVNNVIAENSVNVFPNPAREAATLEFKLSNATKVNITVQDAVGHTVAVVSDATLQQGNQRFNISTSSLAAGLYNIVIRTEEGNFTQRLSVVK